MRTAACFHILLFLVHCGIVHAEHTGANETQREIPSFYFRGEQFPVNIDLSREFRKEIPQQGDMGTCSVYSSIGLIEHACSKLGKSVDLSEGYSVARQSIQNAKTNYSDASYRIDPHKLSSVFSGFFSKDVMQDILEGNVRREDSIKYVKKFEGIHTEMLSHSVPDMPDTRNIPKERLDKFNSLLVEKLERSISNLPTLKSGLQDPELESCINEIGTPKFIGTRGNSILMRMLSFGIPFVCENGRHSFLITGYRRNEKNSEEIDYLTRDSVYPNPKWIKGYSLEGYPPCFKVAAFYPKKQAKKIADAVALSGGLQKLWELKRERKYDILQGLYDFGVLPNPYKLPKNEGEIWDSLPLKPIK